MCTCYNLLSLHLSAIKVTEAFIRSWHDYAVLALLETDFPKHDTQCLASRLGLTVKSTSAALKRLLRLGLIEWNARSKKYRASGKMVRVGKTGHYPLIHQRHVRQMRDSTKLMEELYEKKLHGISDISSVMIAVDSDKIPTARERIKQFRRSVGTYLATGRRNAVYSLSIQLLPISRHWENSDP